MRIPAGGGIASQSQGNDAEENATTATRVPFIGQRGGIESRVLKVLLIECSLPER